MTEKKITLTTAVTDLHGKSSRELTLREPTLKDIVEHGEPITINENGRPIPHPKAIVAIAEECGQIPPGGLNNLSVGDYFAISAAVMGFLEDARLAKSSPEQSGASSSPKQSATAQPPS